MWHSSATTDSSSCLVALITSSFLQIAQRFPDRPQRTFLVLLVIDIAVSHTQRIGLTGQVRSNKFLRSRNKHACLSRVEAEVRPLQISSYSNLHNFTYNSFTLFMTFKYYSYYLFQLFPKMFTSQKQYL